MAKSLIEVSRPSVFSSCLNFVLDVLVMPFLYKVLAHLSDKNDD